MYGNIRACFCMYVNRMYDFPSVKREIARLICMVCSHDPGNSPAILADQRIAIGPVIVVSRGLARTAGSRSACRLNFRWIVFA